MIASFLRDNQIASGGLLLGAASCAMLAARSLLRACGRWVRRLLVAEIEIPGDRSSYMAQVVLAEAARRLGPRLGRLRVMGGDGTGITLFDARDHCAWEGSLAPGTYLLPSPLGGRIVLHCRYTEPTPQTAGRDDVRLVAWGSGRWERLRELIRTAYRAAAAKPGVPILVAIPCGAWTHMQRQATRGADTVVLPAGVMDDLIADAERFLDRQQWYQERGIPWRRSYLFAGPPGSGKTSALIALAARLRLPLHTLSLADPSLTDAILGSLMAALTPPAILALEDVDCVLPTRDRPNSGVSLSGVLAMLDGLYAPPGRIVVMTTNHPDRLDPALLRRGRVDRRIDFGPATPSQAVQLFRRFFPEVTDDQASAFAAQAIGRPMCSLQHHLMTYAELGPDSALDGEWEPETDPSPDRPLPTLISLPSPSPPLLGAAK